jgi:hypothetical protein
MKRLLAVASASLILSLSLAACGGGGGGGGSSSGGGLQSAGFEVPTEISAVPTNLSGSVGGVTKPGLKSKLSALKRAATDPNTDYSKAKTVKFVNEHTLEQFDIIEEVLSAIRQTNYADPANVNQGPYKVMVAWQEERDGIETKTLEPWVVDSAMIRENGRDVNRLRAWIEENREGITMLIKAEFKIYQSATQREDGSYSDYGVWTLNVKFGDSATDFFAASADIDADGHAVIKINEHHNEGPFVFEMKAVMNRAETEGYGKVMFPDWESCNQPDCSPAPVVAKYAYNTTHLAIQKGSDAVQYKDRTSITEMTHRYGMFDSTTGDDVMKTKSFGFPVSYSDSNNNRRWGYYGAWQGRHQLWADGNGIPAGTVVRRQDRGDEQSAESYTVSAAFVGTLTKRTAVAASINDIKGIPVETWVNSNFEIKYMASGSNGAGWYECTHTIDPNTGFFQQNCPNQFTAFDSLIVGQNDNRKFVNINFCDMCGPNNPPTNYVYLPVGPIIVGNSTFNISQAGFYVADMNEGRSTVKIDPQTGQPTRLAESDGIQLWVNIGGSIYIMYNGTGWVEKTLSGFNTETWTPEFDPNGDKPYDLPLDREFYINSRGANYIVKRTSTGYDVKIEIQTTANPLNAATFVPVGTVFKTPWNPEGESTFEFVTDSSSPKFMKLVYKTIGQQDQNATPTPSVGDVATRGYWGLMAYNSNGQSTGIQFNWDYPREGDLWGSQQYLLDSNNNYVLLSDPVRLLPITLTNNAGEEKTLSLQYDGWMHGLPDLFHELWKNGHVMTQDIADKIINIPAGTEVTDADDSSKSYLIKPLEVSQFLNVVSDPGTLDITVADSIDLNSVPVYVEHNMGDMPTTTGVKYSEGILVE